MYYRTVHTAKPCICSTAGRAVGEYNARDKLDALLCKEICQNPWPPNNAMNGVRAPESPNDDT